MEPSCFQCRQQIWFLFQFPFWWLMFIICTWRNNSCLMFTKLRNMIGKIRYALYGIELNAQNFILSHEYSHRDVCVTYHVSLMTQMGRNAAAGLPSSWRRWTEAAFDWCLAWFWAKCHQCMNNWTCMHISFCLSCFLILWTLNKELLRYVQ